jgi:predicted phage terminase large subunit-like protein
MTQLTAKLVEGFVASMLLKKFDDASNIPQFHRELWELACSDHRFVAVAAPRFHAKTTAGTIAYSLAAVLFRQSSYAIIVSDTYDQAVLFLGAIKQELQENQDLIDLFGINTQFIKDTNDDIIVICEDGHKFRMMAKGAEQKLRGLLWNNRRPDLIVCDDLENDELVMNKDRREKLKRWFTGALLPVLSRNGKMRMWGTILHMDSLLENFMPSYTSKDTVYDGLKMYYRKPRGGVKAVKYKAHNEDLTEFLWPERFDKKFFEEKREYYVHQGVPDIYSQEFLNYPLDETLAYFKSKDLLELKEDDKKLPLRYYITADLAISEKETADYSVFVVAGMDENRRIHIKEVIRERLDAKEIIEVIFMLNEIYDPEAIGIEEMQISKAIGPFLREEMMKRNKFPHIFLMNHMNKDKLFRARSIQGRVRARTVLFDKEADWFPDFEDELTKFPRAKNDDQVDAFAYVGLLLDKLIESRSRDDIERDDYEEEYEKAGMHMAGRNRITGY